MEKLVRCTQTRSKLMYYNYHDAKKAFAPMTELVYVLVLEAKFCEFESRLGHQFFYAPLVK